jgi:hypothetical protein
MEDWYDAIVAATTAHTGGMPMQRSRAAESGAVDREHLTRLLLEQMERAYDTEGTGGLSRVLGELLRRLDDRALRDYAMALGFTSELELEAESERDASRSGPPT